jgi:hypothetical protein
MINLQGLSGLGSLAIGQEEPDVDEFSLVPKVKGPKRLLMDLLRQDPAMAEFFKKNKLKGDMGNGSMEPDYYQQS